MNAFRSWLSAVPLLVLALLSFSGCALMGGGGDKADLYRFGMPAEAAAPAEASAPVRHEAIIFYRGAIFQRAASGDRILTIDGTSAAYVAKARWIAPASELFDSAAIQAFERGAPALRIARSELPGADYVLSIEVRRFEAVYASGPQAAPDIVIDAQVMLKHWPDNLLVGDWPVQAREHAGDNRVTAIVAAFDRGTASVGDRIAALVRDAAAARPPRAAG